MTRRHIRQRAEAMIEELIAILDAIDGDADFEIEPDAELDTDLDINPISLQTADRMPPRRISQRAA